MKKRNMMKKFFAVTAACAMAFSLAACSDASNSEHPAIPGWRGQSAPRQLHRGGEHPRRSQEL